MLTKLLCLVPALSLVAGVAAFSQPAAADVDVKVTINQCPTVQWFIAAPLDLYLGGEAEFEFKAVDKDRNPLTYFWIESHGFESNFLGHGTTMKFKCAEPGAFMVRGWASDGSCAAKVEAEVRCYDPDAE